MSREPALDPMFSAIAYLRTRDGGPSLEQQERQVAEAAEAERLVVSSRLVEVAGIATGDIVDRRMQLFELLAEAQSGRAGAVIIGAAKALGDSPIEAAIVAIMLERSGCRVLLQMGSIQSHIEPMLAGSLPAKFSSVTELG